MQYASPAPVMPVGHAGIRTRGIALLRAAIRGLGSLAPAIDLTVRLLVASVFFKSGLTKIASWESSAAACRRARSQLFRASPAVHLVFAFGTRANLDLVPGLAQHALPLKLVGDAMFIRNRVLQRVARIELETDPVMRERLGHFIDIGGASRASRWPARSRTSCAARCATSRGCRRMN